MKRFMPILALALLTSTFAFAVPHSVAEDDMGTVQLRRAQSITVSAKQYKALKANKRFSRVLNFEADNTITAKKGFALLQARNKSFLVWVTAKSAQTNADSAVHVKKSGSNRFSLISKSDFFTGAPAGSGVMLACYCQQGSGQCANIIEEGPDACSGDCCELHGDLITPGGISQREVLSF